MRWTLVFYGEHPLIKKQKRRIEILSGTVTGARDIFEKNNG
jgi:hypothetical protein